MIVVDTTVLVYAVGSDHPLRAPCRDLLQLAADNAVRLTTTVEVIQEFTHVRARRRSRDDAAALARHWLDLTQPLLRPGPEELRAGLELFESLPGLGCFDAVLAATVGRAGASALVSADRAFALVDGLTCLDPGDPEFLAKVREA